MKLVAAKMGFLPRYKRANSDRGVFHSDSGRSVFTLGLGKQVQMPAFASFSIGAISWELPFAY